MVYGEDGLRRELFKERMVQREYGLGENGMRRGWYRCKIRHPRSGTNIQLIKHQDISNIPGVEQGFMYIHEFNRFN